MSIKDFIFSLCQDLFSVLQELTKLRQSDFWCQIYIYDVDKHTSQLDSLGVKIRGKKRPKNIHDFAGNHVLLPLEIASRSFYPTDVCGTALFDKIYKA